MKSILFLIGLSFFITAFSRTKIGVIHKQHLLDSLPSRRMVLDEIREIEAAAVQELTEMDSTLNNMIEYPPRFGCFDGTATKIYYDELWEYQKSISEREKEVDEELNRLIKECNLKSELIIKEATKIVSEKLVLDLVIHSAETVYFKKKLDITNAVLTEMIKIDQSTK